MEDNIKEEADFTLAKQYKGRDLNPDIDVQVDKIIYFYRALKKTNQRALSVIKYLNYQTIIYLHISQSILNEIYYFLKLIYKNIIFY